MKKIFLFLLMIVIYSSVLYAGPFGLEKGMTLEEIKKACGGVEPVLMEEGIYRIEPIKTHPDFIIYGAYIDKKEGLYGIRAIGKDIVTNTYGRELKYEFDSLMRTLEKKYGTCKLFDRLNRDSYYDKPIEWMYSLSLNEREYYAKWQNRFISSLPEELDFIFLSVKANSPYKGFLVLDYYFNNTKVVMEKIDDTQLEFL